MIQIDRKKMVLKTNYDKEEKTDIFLMGLPVNVICEALLVSR